MVNKKIPFKSSELEELVGKNLVLDLFGVTNIKLDNKPSPPQGMIQELIKFEKYSRETYFLGSLKDITDEQGNEIAAIESTKSYLLKLDGVEPQKGQPPILRGEITSYCEPYGKGSIPIGKKIIVYLNKTPIYKEKMKLTWQ